MTELKTEIEGIVRDTTNGALLNRDNVSLDAYKKMKKKNNDIIELQKKVNTFDSRLANIETALGKILEKL